MGTRADFYIGRGKDAEWLGSVAGDGNPEGGDDHGTYAEVFDAGDEKAFRTKVGEVLARRDDGTMPEHGWPWPWEDSCTTDWAYAIDEGVVYASAFGAPWIEVAKYLELDEAGQEAYGESVPKDGGIEHPNMKDRQDVTLGRRSGIMVVGVEDGEIKINDDKREQDERNPPDSKGD